ncbi:MAG: benzoate/H(+) symporter BenE family transporter [Beijerinckiaceae bacterium]
MSQLFSAIVAAFVGFAASVALVLAAAQAIGATPAQTVSMVAALGIAKGAASMLMSWRYRIPMICAWSTPGAALIAASAGINIHVAIGAYLVAALMMIATALVKPLGALVARIPMAIASAMLAGVIVRFVIAVFDEMKNAPLLVGVALLTFLVVRVFNAFAAVIAALAAGVLAAFLTGAAQWPANIVLTPTLQFIAPEFQLAAMIGLGVPLYLVTMASQNLPGFAVLRAAGYEPPVQAALGITGFVSLLTAPFGAHMTNMAAISAAICTGPDTHPDKGQRWKAGLWYGLVWFAIAASAGPLLAILKAMPNGLIIAVAGLGLIGSLAGALATAMQEADQRFAAVITFAVAASSLSLFGIGAAFWSLVIGLAVLALDRAAQFAKRKS